MPTIKQSEQKEIIREDILNPWTTGSLQERHKCTRKKKLNFRKLATCLPKGTRCKSFPGLQKGHHPETEGVT